MEVCPIQNKHKAGAPSDTMQGPPKLLLAKGASLISNTVAATELQVLIITQASTAGHRVAESRWHLLRQEPL